MLTVDDERRELMEAFRAQQAEVIALRETVADRDARIVALENKAARDFECAEAFRDQVWRFRVRLARLIEGIRGESPAIRFRVSTLMDMAAEIETSAAEDDTCGTSEEDLSEFDPVEEDPSEETRASDSGEH